MLVLLLMLVSLLGPAVAAQRPAAPVTPPLRADAVGNPTQPVDSGPTTASDARNGDGLRVAKTVNGVATTYTWDPAGLGAVLSDGTSRYLWGRGLIGAVAGAAASYVQADGLGSVRLVTGAAGATLGSAGYDAYGRTRSTSGAQLPFGFAGEQADAESGLVYLRARYYDPATGRFLTRDGFPGTPSDPQSLDRYAYVEGDPTANTDPSGRCLEDLCIGEAAAAIAIVSQVAPGAIQFLQEYGPEIADAIAAAVSGPARQGGQGGANPSPTPCPFATATPTPADPAITFTDRQLQSQLAQHGADFGVVGSNNAANRQAFELAILNHVNGPDTRRIVGTYRGDPAIPYVDPNTGLDIFTRPDGSFWAGWKLNAAQLSNVLARGSL